MIDPRWEGFTTPPAQVTVAAETDIILPATWWRFITAPWQTPDLSIILREQTIELFHPLTEGERLNCTIILQRLRRRGEHQYADCVLEARTDQDLLVARAVSRLVVR